MVCCFWFGSVQSGSVWSGLICSGFLFGSGSGFFCFVWFSLVLGFLVAWLGSVWISLVQSSWVGSDMFEFSVGSLGLLCSCLFWFGPDSFVCSEVLSGSAWFVFGLFQSNLDQFGSVWITVLVLCVLVWSLLCLDNLDWFCLVGSVLKPGQSSKFRLYLFFKISRW